MPSMNVDFEVYCDVWVSEMATIEEIVRDFIEEYSEYVNSHMRATFNEIVRNITMIVARFMKRINEELK